jgi:uncharacterized coiled-coil DUF342 family protein
MKELSEDGKIHAIKLLTRESMDVRMSQANARLREKDEQLTQKATEIKELQQNGKRFSLPSCAVSNPIRQ